MRQTLFVGAFLLAAALAAGCDARDANAAVLAQSPGAKVTASLTPAGVVAAAQLDKAKAETKQAVAAIDEYVFAKKVEFVANMRNELIAIRDEMDRLAIRIDRADGSVKPGATAKLEALRVEWADAKMRLDLAEGSNEVSWNDLKAGFRKSHADLVATFETTRHWLSDKIEP